jgi:hypothetical protein
MWLSTIVQDNWHFILTKKIPPGRRINDKCFCQKDHFYKLRNSGNFLSYPLFVGEDDRAVAPFSTQKYRPHLGTHTPQNNYRITDVCTCKILTLT